MSSREKRLDAAKYKINSAPNKFDHGVRPVQRVRKSPHARAHTHQTPSENYYLHSFTFRHSFRDNSSKIDFLARQCGATVPTVRVSVRMPSSLMRHGEMRPPHPGGPDARPPACARRHAHATGWMRVARACGATKPANVNSFSTAPRRGFVVVTREPRHSVRRARTPVLSLNSPGPDAMPSGIIPRAACY